MQSIHCMMNNTLIIKAFNQSLDWQNLSLTEWDLLLRQARRGALLARLHAVLDEGGLLDCVPEPARRHLQWEQVRAERHRLAVQWEVAQIRQALAPLNEPLLLLKGAAYVMAELPAARGRLFADIDILVAQDQLNAVEAALMLHGWATTHHDAYDQHYYRHWMHELPPMRHLKRLTVIDVHHAILPQTAALHPDPVELRADSQILHHDLAILASVDLVLHSATHLFHGGELEHGLRDLSDLDCLLRHYGNHALFWLRLLQRAQTLELSRPLFYALRYTRLLLHTPVGCQPDAPNALLLKLMDALFLRALLPDHASCRDGLSGTARRLLYLRAHWQRMPPLLLARHLLHKALFPAKPANLS